MSVAITSTTEVCPPAKREPTINLHPQSSVTKRRL